MSTNDGGIDEEPTNDPTTWGPLLFYATLIGVLVFFWWMVIYDHGVSSTH